MRWFSRLSLPFVPRHFQRSQKFPIPLVPRRWKLVLPLRVILGAMLLIGIGFGVRAFIQAHVFMVKHVTISDVVPIRPNVVPVVDLTRQADKMMHQSMLFLSEDYQSTALPKRYPMLHDVTIKRQFPDTVLVDYQQRLPTCRVVTSEGVFLVDHDGLLFAKIDPALVTPLPTVTVEVGKTHAVGQIVSARGLLLALNLVENLRGPAFQQLSLHDGQLDVHFAQPPLVMISDDKDPKMVVAQLRTLLATFVQDKKTPSEVDMRFDRPVLRY
jgi:hypothetical protein